MRNLSALELASLIMALLLVACLCPLPYGFYTIIRLATAIIAGCWCYRFYRLNKTALAVIAGGIVILFQPLIRIALDRTTWNIIDVLLAVVLLILVFGKKKLFFKDYEK